MPNAQRKRVLPADVYDALELGALVWGGIGAGSIEDIDGEPLCAFGIGAAVCGNEDLFDFDPVTKILAKVGIGVTTNDAAVEAINERLGRGLVDRVTFDQWAAELGVVRGEQ